MVTAVAGSSVLTLVEDMDRTLTVDGKPVSSEVSKTQKSGTTYVALVPMAKELDSSRLCCLGRRQSDRDGAQQQAEFDRQGWTAVSGGQRPLPVHP